MDHPDSIKQPGSSTGKVMRFGSGRHDISGKVEKLPPSLQLLQRAVRLKAEVIAHNRDGTVRVKTSEGEMDLRLKTRDLPPPGQQVEIDLPAGKPPRQALVRPAPDQSPPQSSSPPPAAEGKEAGAHAAYKNAAPLSQETAQNLSEEINKNIPPARQTALSPGDIVRLTALPPQELADLRPLSPATVIPAHLQTDLPISALPLALPPTPETQAASQAVQIVAPPVPTDKAAGFLVTNFSFYQALKQDQPAVSIKPISQTAMAGILAGGPNLTDAIAMHITSGLQADTRAGALLSLSPPALKAAPSVWDITIQNITLPRPVLQPPSALEITAADIQNSKAPADTGTAAVTKFQPTAVSEINATHVHSAPAVSPHTPVFTGKAIGQTPGGLPVIEINNLSSPDVKYFTLNIPASNLWQGSQISFTTFSRPQTAASFGDKPPGYSYNALTSFLPLPGAGWPALEQLTATVTQISPHLASVTSRAVPSPASPQQLPAAAMLFIAAVKAGDLSGWLGQKITDTLRRAGKGEILERLARDFTSLQKTASEPATQDWRALSLPLAWQEEIHHATIFYRQDKQGDDKDKDKKQTRFIFNLDLTRMGAVQLDGLHRQERLDLIVRTQTPLSAAMQRTMRQHYSQGLESVSVKGELSFQFKPEQWVKIEPEARPGITA